MLRKGEWITRDRMRIYGVMMLIATLASLAYLAITSDGLNDYKHRPLGTDFSNVYAAGTYVLEGEPVKPFIPMQQEMREREIFGEETQFYGWHYPPYFLLVAGVLATLPYIPALVFYQLATLALYLRAQWRLWPDRLALLMSLSFPAVLINLGHGHNGFLTAALLTFGLLNLPKRPLLAGVLLGLLVYKPQFGVLIPLALLAGGHWRAIAGATCSVAALTALVTALWGMPVWHAFAESSQFTRTVVLEQGMTGFHKIQTVFAWVRLWGGGVPLAYVAQILAMLLAMLGVVWLWREKTLAMEWKAAGLVLGCCLATPYMLDYDLMALAPVLLWWARAGMREGFGDYEKTLLAVAWVAPFITRGVAEYAYVPLAVWVMLALFLRLLWRVHRRNGA